MLKIDIHSDRLSIKDIQKSDVSFINSMYQDFDFYFYAIGSHTNLCEKYFEQFTEQDNVHSFFCTAKLIEDSYSIGCIRGNIYSDKRKILWITSIMIHKEFCRKGFGTELVMNIINFFKLKHEIEYVCVSVAGRNEMGAKFWEKIGFSVIKTIARYDTKKFMFGDIKVYCKTA